MKLKSWTPQEEEIRRLRKKLSDTRQMIVDMASNNGLTIEECIKVIEFIAKEGD